MEVIGEKICQNTRSYRDATTKNLLGLPIEIRNQIYQYFLTIDRSIEFKAENTFHETFDIQILQINKQIRAEAWDILCQSNIWIELSLITQRKGPSGLEVRDLHSFQLLEVQPCLPLDFFPEKQTSEIRDSASLKLTIGEQCGLSKIDRTLGEYKIETKLFAYSSVTWIDLCADLSKHVELFKKITIKAADEPSMSISAFYDKVLLPLSLIKGADTVHIDGPTELRRMQDLATSMEKLYNSPTDMTKRMELFHNKGDTLFESRHFGEATDWFKIAVAIARSLKDMALKQDWNATTPEFQAVDSMKVDLCNRVSASLIAFVKERKTAEHNNRELSSLIEIAIDHSQMALGWAGLDDEQRAETHRLRGEGYHLRGDFIQQSIDQQSLINDLEPFTVSTNSNTAKRYYRWAALDYFFAFDINRTQANASYLYESFCKMNEKAGQNPKDEPETCSFEIPHVGDWQGDPRFMMLWAGFKMHLMTIYRQRPGGLRLSEEEVTRTILPTQRLQTLNAILGEDSEPIRLDSLIVIAVM